MRQKQSSTIAAASLALGVLAAASFAWGEEPVRIAILPIVVHSAEDPTYLRNGLADMLASRVEQSGRFEVVRVDDLSAATTRLPKAMEAGREAGVDFVLFGSFTRFGTGASLDMQCVSTNAELGGHSLREIFVHTGSIGEVIPDLDELVGKVGRFAIEGFDSEAEVDVASAPPAAGSGDNEGEPGNEPGNEQIDEGKVAKNERDGATAVLEARIQSLEDAVADLMAVLESTEP